ncbi:MAG: AAA family ATPase [Planctomycetota bacterium]|nr:AAA family ATPase [Planctomycetota bacterium]
MLANPNLYDPCLWPELPGEAKRLLDVGVTKLHPEDVKRLNHLLLQSAFPKLFDPQLIDHDAYTLAEHVSTWLRYLVGFPLEAGLLRADRWDMGRGMPCGYLSCYTPLGLLHLHLQDRALVEKHGPAKIGFLNPCMELETADNNELRYFSTGFHQVLPMVVQLGLMQQDEVVAVENPEVHLHPSLQAKVAELFIVHAKTGRCVLLETHSDLIVKRTLRAILEEEIAQSAAAAAIRL